MNTIHRTQFDHERLDHECFDYPSRETYAKHSVGTKAFRPHSLTFGLFDPGKHLWEFSACVPYIGTPCQCIRFDMSNAADTNSLDRRSEGIITVFKNILHVQRLRYFERKQTQQKTVF